MNPSKLLSNHLLDADRGVYESAETAARRSERIERPVPGTTPRTGRATAHSDHPTVTPHHTAR